MKTLNSWHQVPGAKKNANQALAPDRGAALVNAYVKHTDWGAMCARKVMLTNTRLVPFPLYLDFHRLDVLKSGALVAVFRLELLGKFFEAWIAPETTTGIPTVVHATGGARRETDFVIE